jgi:hypothetical protein
VTPRSPSRSSLFVLVVFATQLGCVAWHEGTARKLVSFPTASMQAAPQKSIWIDVTFQSAVTGTGVTELSLWKAERQVFGHATEVVSRSRRFVLAEASESADYRLAVRVVDSGNANTLGAVLSGLTLTILPSWATDKYDIVASLRNKTGPALATRRIHQELTMVIQLFMLFGMPFASPSQVSEQMWQQVFEDLLVFCDDEVGRRERGVPSALPPSPEPATPAPPTSPPLSSSLGRGDPLAWSTR